VKRRRAQTLALFAEARLQQSYKGARNFFCCIALLSIFFVLLSTLCDNERQLICSCSTLFSASSSDDTYYAITEGVLDFYLSSHRSVKIITLAFSTVPPDLALVQTVAPRTGSRDGASYGNARLSDNLEAAARIADLLIERTHALIVTWKILLMQASAPLEWKHVLTECPSTNSCRSG
jgi:hypothetical protein